MNNYKDPKRDFHARSCGALLSLLAVVCMGLMTPSTALSAATPSRIISFDVPGAVVIYVWGIDSAGVIAGQYTDSNTVYHGFTRDASGNIATFDAPGAGTFFRQGTFPEGMSDSGQICGFYEDSESHDHGFLLDSSGVFTTFDVSGAGGTLPSSVNDSGQVAGYYFPNGITTYIGFIWTASGPVTTFAPTGSTEVDNAKINLSGVIAGDYTNTIAKRRGYYRDAGGNITTFVGSPVATFTEVEAINDSGTIVGWFEDPAFADHGFLRQGKNLIQIDIAGAVSTFALAVNASGTVAGSYYDASGVSHSFTRDRLGNIVVFDDADAGTGSGQGTFATSINATGQVAGYFLGPLGNWHGFVQR